MKTLQPVNGNVAIRWEDKFEEKTTGGIIIPDTAKEKPSEGIVESIAVDATEQIAIGDKVIYKSYSGSQVTFEGKDYMIVPVGDIIAKIVDVDEI